MKKFFKTLIGKTILFISCLLALNILIGTIALEVIMQNEDFYLYEKNDVITDCSRYFVNADLNNLLQNNIMFDEEDNLVIYLDEQFDDLNYDFQIFDSNGNVYYSTNEFIKCENHINSIYPNYSIAFRLKDTLVKKDNIYYVTKIASLAYDMRFSIYLITAISALLLIFSFICFLDVVNKEEENDDFNPGPLFKYPFDLLIAISLAICSFALYIAMNVIEFALPVAVILFIFIESILLGLLCNFFTRIKQRTIIKNNITYILIVFAFNLTKKIINFILNIIKGMWHLLMQIPFLTKTTILIICLSFFEILLRRFFVLYFLEKIVLLFIILYMALCLKRLQQTAKALAQGDFTHQVDTSKMTYEFKKHGEYLNEIADGIDIAVSEKLKSERMKTELITNVSHDLKTPLTSLINYASLISEEKQDINKINEYSEVLVRQSSKLTRLIEDLIEASKASSGNLEVNLERCDANIFLTQALGEYEDKLKENDLSLVVSSNDEPLMINADGRRMWRIFDNLMNNICKYSLNNTRVYIELQKIDNEAVFIFKNTSREQLNITEEELMERFVRGDKSRNTEGNGLGLSIAKSMAELQNGILKIQIDGDLFKAILSFPIC